MPTRPPPMLPLLAPFAPHVSQRGWAHAQVVILSAILAPARRPCAALRVMGRDPGRRVARFHRVLTRDRWSGAAVSRTLLGLLVAAWYGRVVEVATVWDHAGLPLVSLRWVLSRDPADTFAPQALRCTDPAARPEPILSWFVPRWYLEVTVEETRRHLGIEPQRPWSDEAIRRPTPTVLGLCSLVPLLAHPHMTAGGRARQAAWERTTLLPVAYALASVRHQVWGQATFSPSPRPDAMGDVSRVAVERVTDALCYAA